MPIPLKINLGFIAGHTLLTLEIVIFITYNIPDIPIFLQLRWQTVARSPG